MSTKNAKTVALFPRKQKDLTKEQQKLISEYLGRLAKNEDLKAKNIVPKSKKKREDLTPQQQDLLSKHLQKADDGRDFVKKKDLIDAFPNKRDELTIEQKSLIIKYMGSWTGYAFFFGGIYLLWARRYGAFFLTTILMQLGPIGFLINLLVIYLGFQKKTYDAGNLTVRRVLLLKGAI